MMSLRIRNWALAVALAVMPLQGVAATLTVLLCHGDAQAHATHAGAGQGQDAHGAHAEGHDGGNTGDDDRTGAALYHLCCQFSVAAPAAVTLPASPATFPALALAPAPLHGLFIPDRPQRPPLA